MVQLVERLSSRQETEVQFLLPRTMEKEEIQFNRKDWKIERIDTKETAEWMLFKHYARRKAPVVYAFGLFDKDHKLQGICTFGMPCVQMNNGKCIFYSYRVRTLELNRLCVNDNLGKNVLSFFVSWCIKLIPDRPLCLVSFADPSNGHQGYIYQATNWLYTGKSQIGGKNKKYIFEGRNYHGKTVTEKWVTEKFGSYDKDKTLPQNCESFGMIVENFGTKHRYIMFLGTEKEKKDMYYDCVYTFMDYPKGENTRYDSSYEVKHEI